MSLTQSHEFSTDGYNVPWVEEFDLLKTRTASAPNGNTLSDSNDGDGGIGVMSVFEKVQLNDLYKSEATIFYLNTLNVNYSEADLIKAKAFSETISDILDYYSEYLEDHKVPAKIAVYYLDEYIRPGPELKRQTRLKPKDLIGHWSLIKQKQFQD